MLIRVKSLIPIDDQVRQGILCGAYALLRIRTVIGNLSHLSTHFAVLGLSIWCMRLLLVLFIVGKDSWLRRCVLFLIIIEQILRWSLLIFWFLLGAYVIRLDLFLFRLLDFTSIILLHHSLSFLRRVIW